MIHEIEQRLQEEEYDFPYHYIPHIENGALQSHRYWSWGYKYVAGIKLILSEIDKLSFENVLDLGCGDGRFVRELAHAYPDKRVTGIDYSNKAIALAQAFNPTLDFRVLDIVTASVGETFDLITLIEVLEHIPPAEIPTFVEGIKRHMHPSSRLLITVPHVNQPRLSKHYQHFSIESLTATLANHFVVEQAWHFDKRARFMAYVTRLLGNETYLITSPAIRRWATRLYERHYLMATPQDGMRLMALLSLK